MKKIFISIFLFTVPLNTICDTTKVLFIGNSYTYVIDHYRYNSMYPASEILDSMIRANSSSSLFYMTWGRKIGGQQCIGGYCSPVFTDYFHMQDSLQSAYTQISQILGAKLCPVGLGWKKALIMKPNTVL